MFGVSCVHLSKYCRNSENSHMNYVVLFTKLGYILVAYISELADFCMTRKNFPPLLSLLLLLLLLLPPPRQFLISRQPLYLEWK